MKFLYEYRTSDNVKHDDVICASDRDAAYAALKKRGIKPSRLVEAPGVVNYLVGRGKRWIVVAALVVVSVALALSVKRNRIDSVAVEEVSVALNTLDSPMRRQVIGDAGVIGKGVRTGWADVFEHDGERFLSSFAIPGVPAGVRATSEDEVRAALSRKIEVSAEDSIESRQIKAMVEGMKGELRRFLADGGTIVQYGKRLVERQEMEIAYYNRAKATMERAMKDGVGIQELDEIVSKENAGLRKMGIKLVVLPD